MYSDHLGSVDVITNAAGLIEQKLSFDAFGKRRAVFNLNNQPVALTLAAILNLTHRGFTGHLQVDHANVIHMGGRIYDAHIGRFLQADPFVQAPSNSQNHNRYSYVLNNPLSYTDPSGYFFKKLKQFVGVIIVAVASVYCAGTCTAGMWMMIGGAAGAANAAVNGDNILKGAIIGAFTSGVAAGAGGGWQGFFANAAAGGFVNSAVGGNFGHGFWSAGLSSAVGGRINTGNATTNVVIAGVVGGTISKITGGKFANGATSAAFSAAMQQLFKPGLSKVSGQADGQNAGLDPEVKSKLAALMATDRDAAVKYAAEHLGLDFDGARSVTVELNRALYGRVDHHGAVIFGRDAFNSPEALLSTVGHEWVHLQQWKNGYMHTSGAMRDVNEIEAYQWELDNLHRTGFRAGVPLINNEMSNHFKSLQGSSDLNNWNSYYWRAKRGIYTRIDD